ncbi:MAG: MotA/TolQ/ExbB proton channel family protein [Pseudomonadota bacterium]
MTGLGIHTENPAVWLILITATVAYGLIFDLWMTSSRDAAWCRRCARWGPGIRTLLGALPLLGLYGTVVGLMQTFRQMAVDHGFNPESLATGGIATAMYSTQLGLLLVIPGWVFLALLQSRARRARAVLRKARGSAAAEEAP